jgi:hypothetical protein
MELLSHPTEGDEATIVGVMAGRGGKIEVHYPSPIMRKSVPKSGWIARLGN